MGELNSRHSISAKENAKPSFGNTKDALALVVGNIRYAGKNPKREAGKNRQLAAWTAG